MRSALVILAIIAFVTAFTEEFERFRLAHHKYYSSDAEAGYRFRVFQDNMERAQELSARDPSAQFGVTRFMDLTPEEFRAQYLMNNLNMTHPTAPVVDTISPRAVPSTFDWNNKAGIVTPVKNQEQCGSCWAFSATETIESTWAVANRNLPILGPQQIVDCDTVDQGCNGGWPYDAYQYVISAGGQDTEVAYPYVGYDQTCAFVPSAVAAKLKSWKYVTQSQSETQIQQYVFSNSPVSVCVDAEVWQYYTGGVVTAASCGTSIDHCVQITGWSVQSGVTAWNVRNSWGTTWGNNGYIYVQYGSNACAIAEVVTVPIPQ